jgi:UDP-glucoronosyl and UDP-glucosyl transferase
MYEALYHGVPTIAVPLSADQFDNAECGFSSGSMAVLWPFNVFLASSSAVLSIHTHSLHSLR